MQSHGMQPVDTSMPLLLSPTVTHSQTGPSAITRLGLIPTTPKRMADTNAIKGDNNSSLFSFHSFATLRIPKDIQTRRQSIVEYELCQYFWQTIFLLQI